MENTERRRDGPRGGGGGGEDRVNFELSGNLPTEIIFDIVIRLPLKSLSKYRWVCKSWFNAITGTHFARTHYINSLQRKNSPCVLLCNRNGFALVDHQAFDDHQISITSMNVNLNELQWSFSPIVGSINGLVCLCARPSSSFGHTSPTLFYIWNPIAQEYVILPKSPKYQCEHTTSGFGFNSALNEYKVIRIFSPKWHWDWESTTDGAEAEIYTLGSGSWREIKAIPFCIEGGNSGVLANGSLYWSTMDNVLAIASFNLKTEEFGVVNMPPPIKSHPHCTYLDVLEDQLCILNWIHGNNLLIWVMEHYGGNKSWSVKYKVRNHVLNPTYGGVYNIMKVKTGELLLWTRDSDPELWPGLTCRYSGARKYLSYYETQTKAIQPIDIQSDLSCWRPFVFRGSLYSPKSVEGTMEWLPSS